MRTSPVNPPLPSFPRLTPAKRKQIFGSYKFVAAPTPRNPEAIKILDDWESKNIVKVEIPQLIGVRGAPKSGKVRFHRFAAKQLQELWVEWQKAGLLDHVLTWDGSFNARFIRGSKTALSNHAFGTAFDINAKWNPFRKQPATRGTVGSVRELVTIAHKHGFYWGGHFSGPDGMHFEVAKLMHPT